MRASGKLLALSAALVAAAAVRAMFRLPVRNLPDARARPDVSQTRLAKTTQPAVAVHPGLSGVHLLADGPEAFATRMSLTRQAEKTLDLQYYIWHGDRTGTMLLEEVLTAAERGVHVRLLLDDNGIDGLDKILFALDRHSNIEVRLFNPFPLRWPKVLGYVFDFPRLNRRMHNKSFTVDGQVTLVGGRNIGDEYFGVADGALFADLDVLTIGPVVADVEAQFETYWNAASSFPARLLLRRVGPRQLRRLRRRTSIVERDPTARRYMKAIRDLDIVSQLSEARLPLEWAKVSLLHDDPAKALVHGDGKGGGQDARLSGLLENAIGTPERELAIIAGYFVPGRRGVANLRALRARGVEISILTNAYEATDVGAVHAGYAPYREALLRAGVKLYEMCDGVRQAPSRRERRKGSRLGVASRLRGSGSGSTSALRAGASTLHAKTFSVDRQRLFVGSFNFDPRSRDLNTEMGFVIDSPKLAGLVADTFTDVVPDNAYELALTEHRGIVWNRTDLDAPLRREPGMGVVDRLVIGVLKRLNIEWLL